jgi:signal transduction histidine kinase
VVIIYVSSLIAVLIAVGLAEYLQFIPHFSLTTAAGSLYFEHFFIRTAGLCTTLVISAYLITSIKKRIEEKGRRVEIELDHYRSLDKIKSNFILQVTHELRGPLAALMGYHEMIMRGITGPIHEKTKSTIFKANRRTANLLTMIDEMIDYAYMKSEEEVELPKTETSLKEAFDHNFDLFLNPAKEKGITFTSNCSKDLKIMTNRDLLNIILSNLLSNAIRYSPAQTSVTVNAERENDEIHIMVKDEGIGIKPDEIDRIFEEFYIH